MWLGKQCLLQKSKPKNFKPAVNLRDELTIKPIKLNIPLVSKNSEQGVIRGKMIIMNLSTHQMCTNL